MRVRGAQLRCTLFAAQSMTAALAPPAWTIGSRVDYRLRRGLSAPAWTIGSGVDFGRLIGH